MKVIVDSRLSLQEALAQNPGQPCPEEILKSLGLMDVSYIGFDGKLHEGQIVVATKVVPDVEAFFRHALEMNFPIAKVIPVSSPKYKWNSNRILENNVSSGFDYRPVAGTDRLSLHSYGLAFDINPVQNPYIRFEKGKKIVAPTGAIWNPDAPGTLYGEHPLVHLMEGFGWEWGGHWTKESGRTDYQHFQKYL